MSMTMLEYGHLGDINRGIQRLTRTVQAQGSGATVPVETYNQLFASYEQARAQTAVAEKKAEHWENEARKMERNNSQWVEYAEEQEARALSAESELRRLRARCESSIEAAD
ncbi:MULTISPECIES: hypothetical protein [Asaia]|uniref:Flagellar FliJ protein n=1 Tax=Asaia spathodeae TaxID=657016 RepID=A0ABX2P861_9PROT|nr:hypothetical protein [Asaia spathodeae]GBR20329.1 hypothetical protein AA105894_2533 [Asaia spathodeae NBRC 105894]